MSNWSGGFAIPGVDVEADFLRRLRLLSTTAAIVLRASMALAPALASVVLVAMRR